MHTAKRDFQTLWHPCSQMKDYETFPPLRVVKAKGSYLILNDGARILDAISSWWCKNLGHGHPRLLQALSAQSKKFEHVILANTTNEIIINLSEALTQLTTHLTKIFYASDGSCAVEIALKMQAHAREIRGQPKKKQIIALANGYHGETLLALAASDLGMYRRPYEHFLPKIHFLQNIPYVTSRQDPLWQNCKVHWLLIEKELQQYQNTLSAIILEPIIQGAGGMRIYSQDFLRRLRSWCTQHDVYLIADEIMTGFGRTGKMFAYQHANIEPDLLCIGKGMTGGVLPMSAVLVTQEMYQLFYDDYESGKSFLHSHTHTGNALAAAVALECLHTITRENILFKASELETKLHPAMLDVALKTKRLINIRAIGGIVAADLLADSNSRTGYRVYQHAVKLGALLRPLGNTLYWLPPLNINTKDIKKLRDITMKAIMAELF